MDHIKATFAKCKEQKRAALVSYITAGYPTVEETVDILLGLESGGAGTSPMVPWSRITGLVKYRGKETNEIRYH